MLLAAATVNFNVVYQTMDGFGVQPGWGDNPNPTDYALQVAFSQTSGIGLSYLRGSLCWNGYDQQTNMAKRAAAYGVQQIMSRGPAVAWITDFGNDTNGYLDPAHYQDYANMVADFLENSAAQGIPVYAISMDVESDMTTEITSRWNGEQFAALIPYFGNTFRSRGITTKIMINEDVGWNYSDINHIMADPDLSQYADIIAFHAYGQVYNPYAPVTNVQGRPVWMTEFFPDASGTDIQNAISQATDMHNAITVGNASAYIHAALNFGEAGLMSDWNTPNKNLWAMGNYSKFVRPGWVSRRRDRRRRHIVDDLQGPGRAASSPLWQSMPARAMSRKPTRSMASLPPASSLTSLPPPTTSPPTPASLSPAAHSPQPSPPRA